MLQPNRILARVGPTRADQWAATPVLVCFIAAWVIFLWACGRGFDFGDALYVPAKNGRRKAVGVLDYQIVVLIFSVLGDEAISAVSLRTASKKERTAYASRD